MQEHKASLTVCISKAFGLFYHFVEVQRFNQRGYMFIVENMVKFNDGVTLAGNDASEVAERNLSQPIFIKKFLGFRPCPIIYGHCSA